MGNINILGSGFKEAPGGMARSSSDEGKLIKVGN